MLRGAVSLTVAIIVGAGASSAAAATRRTTTLRGSVLPGLSAITSRAVQPSQRMSLSIAVGGRDDAGLASAYRSIYTPGSAGFHRFLSTRQVARRFGAPDGRWRSVKRWLRAGGLQVSYASATHDLLVVSAGAASIQRRLHLSLRSYTRGGEDFVANTGPPHVPASLNITSILGLNTLQRAIPTTRRTRTAQRQGLLARAGQLLTSVLDGLGAANLGEQSPQDVLGAYEAPAGDTGTGQSVAILGAGETGQVARDLAVFEGRNGLPKVPAHVTNVGPGPFTDTSGLAEWDIDTQAAVGMARGLDHLQLYFGKDLTDATVAGLLSAWQQDPHGPLQANASFGECVQEPLGNAIGRLPLVGDLLSSPTSAIGSGLINRLQPVAEQILARATLQGKTLFAASGDTGSSCPVLTLPVVGAGNGLLNQVVPFTLYPTSSPSVTSVGGTVLYTKPGSPPSRALEYAWTFGGGGDAFFVERPHYQDGVGNLTLPCLTGADGGLRETGKPCRGVPDVSALSGDVLTNNYPTISDGKPSPGGGTSLSSPLWAGLWARAQSHVGGTGLGFANETIYRLGKDPATRARDFHDITQGLLGLPLVGNGLYLTQPGWDYATGWGPPRLANFIADAAASR